MADPSRPSAAARAAQVREERLASALRENLRRRKDQARARAEAEPDPAPDPDAPDSAPRRP